MAGIRKGLAVVLSLVGVALLLQTTGSYLIETLSTFSQEDGPAEAQLVRQMVLQLEPMEYYTIQLGAYETVEEGQARINQLARLGYRVMVSQGPPYQLWLGCMGVAPQLETLPQALRETSPDLFVQKQILNQYTFRFWNQDSERMEQVCTLLTSYDIVLKHSLRMFQDYRYAACDQDTWAGMVEQIQGELAVIEENSKNVLAGLDSESMANSLLDLLAVSSAYGESLQRMQEKKTDRMVLLSQSCLQELILQYHTLIQSQSQAEIDS